MYLDDNFDCIFIVIFMIVGIIIGIFIGKCITNHYSTCFVKEGVVYCERKGDPNVINKIGVLKGNK